MTYRNHGFFLDGFWRAASDGGTNFSGMGREGGSEAILGDLGTKLARIVLQEG